MSTGRFAPEIYKFRPLTSPNTLFLDRDGVLNRVVLRGNEVSAPRTLSEFRIADDIDALAQDEIVANWNFVVVTNQPDISRGWVSRELMMKFHDRISEKIPLNAAYVCPHLSEDLCPCRKPASGLIDIFRLHNPNLRGRSVMVGDRGSDFFCAQAAGLPFVLLRRPYNDDLIYQGQKVVNNLWELKAQLINQH